MRRVVWRAELARPPAGQRLRLITAGEKREFLGIGFADFAEPTGCDIEGFVPFDLGELARTARADAL